MQRALPFLINLRQSGCKTFVECTPAFLGRDVELLSRLAEMSGLQILTNTGYYGAVDGKYLPEHAFREDARQLAARWIREAGEGIEGSEILPGFIKIGVNKGPLNEMDRKLVEAAALTHKKTGLSISSHTGDGAAAMDQISILKSFGVHSGAFRWVHAQNETNMDMHIEAAKSGAWIEFDGINEKSADVHIRYLINMKKHKMLGQCLISQDSGWYHVGEENGRAYRKYTYLFEQFLDALTTQGFSRRESKMLLVRTSTSAAFPQ